MRRLIVICTAEVLLIALILLATPQLGHADTVYNDGGIHNIDTSMPLGTVAIGTQTTVNVLTGGNITGGTETHADGIEIVQGTANIYGGDITGGNGEWTSGISIGIGNVNIYGGNISGGSGGYAIGISLGKGVANIYGGNIMGGSGTYVSAIQADLLGTVNIYGGNFKGGTGTYSADIDAGQGTVNIYGKGFNYDLGPIPVASGTLTGTLADGSLLNVTFSRSSIGDIVLIPEPASALMFAFGAALIGWRRKKC